jgi:hypothetical protein
MTSKFRASWIELAATLLIVAGTSRCGGGSSTPPPPPPAAITVSISPGSATVQSGGTQQLTATVKYDSSNAGVTWTITCSSMPCGTLSATSSLSGTPITYTLPITLPAANLGVTLTATSVADPTKSASAAITVPQIQGFSGVSEAHVDTVNGVTRLIINGKPAPPLIFMYQEDFSNNLQFLAPQVQDAAAAGVHLYSVSPNAWPWDNGGTAPLDFSATDQLLDNVIKVDPKAVLLLQIGVWPGPGWIPPVAPTAADQILYLDGATTDTYHVSMASDIYFNGLLTSLPHLIQHFETSSYADHLLGYRFCGGNSCEWFPVDMYTRGIDYSPVNTQAFQAWLLKKYGTDAALSAAWGMPVTIATAQVPLADSSRFPLHLLDGQSPPLPIEAFYSIPGEQNWIDFSAYTSDLFGQRILDIASLVRTQTAGKRLIGFYNGYSTELAASFNAHPHLAQLLASPNIDFICAPIGYITWPERLAGGSGQSQGLVDSVVTHGKLWFDENDLPTYLSNPGAPYATADLTQTVDVLQRDLASILVHRTATWWMDLLETGAFNDPGIWTPMSQYGIPLFNPLYANPQPYHADVALIVDPNSILYQKNDMDMVIAQRSLLRDLLPHAGASSGMYSLADFLDGTEPPSPVYIFGNTFYLTDSQISLIQSRLNAEGATAIWQYAPGFLGPNGADFSRVSTLTGIQVSQSDGYAYTSGTGVMAGYNWGFTNQNWLSPRLVVTDSSAEILGRYQSDNQISSARKKVGNFESIFMGDFALGDLLNFCWSCVPNPLPDSAVLRALLQTTGVHIWSTTGDVVFTDGNLLVIHAAAAGPDTISLPAGVSATPFGGGSASTGTLNLTFSRVGETQWFQLSPGPPGAKLRVQRRTK